MAKKLEPGAKAPAFTLKDQNGESNKLSDFKGSWVVIYFYDGDHHEGQCTVVTETHGPLAGKRVVRGREAEQRRHVA